MLTQQILLNELEYKDGCLYWKTSRKGTKAGAMAGSKTKAGYLHFQLNYKYMLVHRAIFLMHYGYLPKIVDHIDGNPQNNKIENLREANASQNSFNRKYTNSASGYKGITWSKQDKRWVPQISKYGKKIYLGKYKNLEDAIKIYHQAVNMHHGDYKYTEKTEK